MKFFIDTANIDEIKEAASVGVLDGVTTNPTFISREISARSLTVLSVPKSSPLIGKIW